MSTDLRRLQVMTKTHQLVKAGEYESFLDDGLDRLRLPLLILGPAEGQDAPDEVRSTLIARNFVPRAGRPADIAHCALYLASDEAEWVTGAQFVIDGGSTAGTT